MKRYIRVFITTFIFACILQVVLISFYKSFKQILYQTPISTNKFKIFDRKHVNISNKEYYHLLKASVDQYFKQKEQETKDLHIEKLANQASDLLKLKLNNKSLILEYKWSGLENLPYFFSKGKSRPNIFDSKFSNLAIWPEDASHDRIINQLMYIPRGYDKRKFNHKLKKILLLSNKYSFNKNNVPTGQKKFIDDNCPVNTCEIVRDFSQAVNADAIIFNEKIIQLKHKRLPHQIWIFYNLESPSNTPHFEAYNLINWTATYRTDSDIVTPYEKFVKYSEKLLNIRPNRDIAKGKSKKVAWFASNCGSSNKRDYYVKHLQNYIDVDIYGRCGKYKCAKSQAKYCFSYLRQDYKFYLSFENSNCRDYITEKFFLNALQNDVLPIVLGATKTQYAILAPPFSYIHVDEFESVAHLSRYLYALDGNHTLYNQYFAWQKSGEFINTFFWCRLCAMLHAPLKTKVYPDLEKWWKSSNVCNDRQTLKYLKNNRI